jgi:hypothetical protein
MLHHNLASRNDFPGLCPKGGIGIELGVWKGDFSKLILEKSELGLLVSIDAWSTGNWSGPKQYAEALQKLAVFGGRSIVLKMDFNDAAIAIPNAWADFIYIDGKHQYEHINNDLHTWWPKLKPGGLLAGHDYEKYQNFGVIKAVDQFVKKKRLKLQVTNTNAKRDGKEKPETDWGFRSWFFFKK